MNITNYLIIPNGKFYVHKKPRPPPKPEFMFGKWWHSQHLLAGNLQFIYPYINDWISEPESVIHTRFYLLYYWPRVLFDNLDTSRFNGVPLYVLILLHSTYLDAFWDMSNVKFVTGRYDTKEREKKYISEHSNLDPDFFHIITAS